MQTVSSLFLVLVLSIQNAFAVSLSPPVLEYPEHLENDPEAKKTYEQYWEEVGLKFDELYRVLSVSNCYQSVLKFKGCYHALEAVSGFSNPTNDEIYKQNQHYRVVFLESRLSDVTVSYTVLKKFGPLVVLDVDQAKTREMQAKKIEAEKGIAPIPKGRAELKAGHKAAAEKEAKALEALFENTKTNPVNFIGVVEWFESQYISKTPTKVSFVAGMAINYYIHVVKDPHSEFEPMAYLKDMMKPNAGTKTYFGVGCYIRGEGGKVFLSSPFRGSSALAAGLRANDQLVAVDGYRIPENADLTEIIKKIQGDQGTTVTFSVVRNGKELVIPVVRGPVVTGQNVESYMLDDAGKKIGYVRLDNFMEVNGCSEVNKAIADLTLGGAAGLVFDLRGNGGGSLNYASCIASIFVGPKKLIAEEKSLIKEVIKDAKTVSEPFYQFAGEIDPKTKRPKLYNVTVAKTDLPVVTLINSGSASASEIVSGALQYYQRSLILGERSFGKATVQGLYDYAAIAQQLPTQDVLSNAQLGLPESTVFDYNKLPTSPLDVGKLVLRTDAFSKLVYKMTIQRFYMPSGFTNQIVGITPDIEVFSVPNPTENDKVAEREEDQYGSLVSAAGVANNKVFPKLQEIKSCMSKAGLAEKLYGERQQDAILPDYQLLSAQAALSCM